MPNATSHNYSEDRTEVQKLAPINSYSKNKNNNE